MVIQRDRGLPWTLMGTSAHEGEWERRPPPSLDELEADYLENFPPPSDNTPLTEDELADLRRRLNAPGGARLQLTYRERAARWEVGIIRPREVVANLRQQVQRERDLLRVRQSSRAMADGVIDAIDFATGATPTAPITGRRAENQPPAVNELTRVQVLAQDIAEGREPDPSGHGRDYAVGVEHTIMWLLASTEQRPWSGG
jgi:hypothetical protein